MGDELAALTPDSASIQSWNQAHGSYNPANDMAGAGTLFSEDKNWIIEKIKSVKNASDLASVKDAIPVAYDDVGENTIAEGLLQGIIPLFDDYTFNEQLFGDYHAMVSSGHAYRWLSDIPGYDGLTNNRKGVQGIQRELMLQSSPSSGFLERRGQGLDLPIDDPHIIQRDVRDGFKKLIASLSGDSQKVVLGYLNDDIARFADESSRSSAAQELAEFNSNLRRLAGFENMSANYCVQRGIANGQIQDLADVNELMNPSAYLNHIGTADDLFYQKNLDFVGGVNQSCDVSNYGSMGPNSCYIETVVRDVMKKVHAAFNLGSIDERKYFHDATSTKELWQQWQSYNKYGGALISSAFLKLLGIKSYPLLQFNLKVDSIEGKKIGIPTTIQDFILEDKHPDTPGKSSGIQD